MTLDPSVTDLQTFDFEGLADFGNGSLAMGVPWISGNNMDWVSDSRPLGMIGLGGPKLISVAEVLRHGHKSEPCWRSLATRTFYPRGRVIGRWYPRYRYEWMVLVEDCKFWDLYANIWDCCFELSVVYVWCCYRLWTNISGLGTGVTPFIRQRMHCAHIVMMQGWLCVKTRGFHRGV